MSCIYVHDWPMVGRFLFALPNVYRWEITRKLGWWGCGWQWWWMYACMYCIVCMYVCMVLYVCMYVCVCVYVCVYVCMHACMYVYLSMYVCMHGVGHHPMMTEKGFYIVSTYTIVTRSLDVLFPFFCHYKVPHERPFNSFFMITMPWLPPRYTWSLQINPNHLQSLVTH